MRFRPDVLIGVALAWALTGCGSDPASSGGNQGPSKPVSEKTFTLPGAAKLDMVRVDPGSFTMGSPGSEASRDPNESPQHQVTISKGFYLGKYEVTQGQWESVMKTRPWSGQANVVENPDHPAVYLSWGDAGEFIQKINAAEGAAVYRLPTEAEWEYACRAGSGANSRWSFGDQESRLKDYAWYDADATSAGEDYAHRVGTKQPNPWGFYDLHGNVWEWAQDWYSDYTADSQTDPKGPASGSQRVLRGGSFNIGPPFVRSARRGLFSPTFRASYLGLRLLRLE
ncbi:MAG: formylglycine-generating enzyme family protein [Candidatus Latescibacteria bacterium]|nr:formylglycine-generating enzyme family protein [Candidatus Latescibacterota bacterium]